VVTQEGVPSLGRRPTSPDHVLRDARLSDLEAELEQLAVDARRTPQRIFPAHLAYQRAQLWGDFRAAAERAGFPTPVAAEAGPMPTHEGLGTGDRDGLEDRWKPPIQLDQEKAICARQLDATSRPPLQHDQLMPERCILCLKPADRPERRNQQPQKEEVQPDHRSRRYVIPLPDQTDEVFGIHNPSRLLKLAFLRHALVGFAFALQAILPLAVIARGEFSHDFIRARGGISILYRAAQLHALTDPERMLHAVNPPASDEDNMLRSPPHRSHCQ